MPVSCCNKMIRITISSSTILEIPDSALSCYFTVILMINVLSYLRQICFQSCHALVNITLISEA